MRKAQHKIECHQEYLRKRDGFLANPEFTTKHNAQQALSEMTMFVYKSRVKNMTYHDLCTFRPAPAGVSCLLGLSLSYCLRSPRPNQDIDQTMTRLRNDVRRKSFFFGNPEGEYNKKIYIKSDWKAPEADRSVEEKMNAFENELRKLAAANMKQKKRTNLTLQQQNMRNTLKQNRDKWTTCSADKNLGTCLIETERYHDKAWSDHLSDTTTYQVIPPPRSAQQSVRFSMQLIRF